MIGKKTLHFTKMHGIGNDYIYIDALGSPESFSEKDFDYQLISRKVSDRHFGIGSDGLIAILPSSNADFRMRMFNADGSEAQMCGNGIRCVGKYLYDKGFTSKTRFSVETLAGIKELELHLENGEAGKVTVDMGKAYFLRKDIPASGAAEENMIDEEVWIGVKSFIVTGIGMGNPHGVIFAEELTDDLVLGYGPKLEIHSIWPEKANIEFVKILSPDHMEMRVWERGSGETLACGTGACAAVVAAFLKGLCKEEVRVSLLGGDLKVEYEPSSDYVFMTGPASFIAEGEFFL